MCEATEAGRCTRCPAVGPRPSWGATLTRQNTLRFSQWISDESANGPGGGASEAPPLLPARRIHWEAGNTTASGGGERCFSFG